MPLEETSSNKDILTRLVAIRWKAIMNDRSLEKSEATWVFKFNSVPNGIVAHQIQQEVEREHAKHHESNLPVSKNKWTIKNYALNLKPI